MRIPLASLVLVAGAALALAGCGADAPPPGPPGAATPVTVVTLAPQAVTLTRELPGRTAAYAVAEVRPQVGGVVRERLFTEGGTVQAGQPLYQLDDAAYRAEAEAAAARLARAEAQAEVARLKAARAAELAKIDALSKQELEDAVASQRQADADVALARAELAAARVTLERARIVAPIGGRAGTSTVTPGALVTANQAAALTTVQRLDPIYVDVTQSSREWLELRRALDAGRLASGSKVPVEIVLEDGNRHAQPGRLAATDVRVDPATGSYALRLVVPNPDGLLLPGMFVRALVPGGVRADALLVPQRAVTRDPRGNATTLVVDKDGKVEQRAIQVSRALGDQWLVESGLAAGDRVIVEGLQKVMPGMPVAPTEAGAAPAAAAPQR